MPPTPEFCCTPAPDEAAACCGPANPEPRHTSDDYQREYSPTVADKWDQLIDWDHRDTAEAVFFTRLLRDHGAATVLDTACGTGYHAWALTRAGFAVTASDGAPQMVRKTRENMTDRSVDIAVYEADWRTLSGIVPGRYDAVLCLGNSFSHLFAPEDRARTLAEFHAMLQPGGILLLDHRNYDALLAGQFTAKRRNYCCGAADVNIAPSIVNDEVVHFRYDFPDGTSHEVTQSPLLQDEVTGLLQQAGFETVTRYGDMQAPYDPADADFIIQAARRH